MTPLDLIVPPVPPAQRSDVEEIDAALAEAFAPQECGYCGQPCEGRWCSAACRAADTDDSQHRGEE